MDVDWSARREAMVRDQIAARGLADPALLQAFRDVPREQFVPPDLADQAYEDRPLPITAGQTISQPYIVAYMIAAAELRPGQRLLEIGAGSGYAAAIMGRIVAEVIAIERHAALARLAAERMERLGYGNVRVLEGDGSLGFPAAAPFDAIIVSAAGSHVPTPLLDQLADDGVLVMPVGPPDGPQHLIRVTRRHDGLHQEKLDPVRFVPLIGREGWDEPR